MKATRYNQLSYRREAPGQWSIYDNETGGSIGPKYRTETELLADLNLFAETRGYE